MVGGRRRSRAGTYMNVGIRLLSRTLRRSFRGQYYLTRERLHAYRVAIVSIVLHIVVAAQEVWTIDDRWDTLGIHSDFDILSQRPSGKPY
jgi:hypothetical protein